jgi:hypothetical protein
LLNPNSSQTRSSKRVKARPLPAQKIFLSRLERRPVRERAFQWLESIDDPHHLGTLDSGLLGLALTSVGFEIKVPAFWS